MQNQEKNKDLKYKVRSFRLADETYEELVRTKPLKQSWNLFFRDLLRR